jgi:hypothetical protein
MTDENKKTCSETVFPQERWGSYRGHKCTKPVWKDGYCKIHHPDSVKAREEMASKRYEEKYNNSIEQRLLRRVKELEKDNEILKSQLEVYAGGYQDETRSQR